MTDSSNQEKSSLSIDYVDDSDVVFRVSWYAVAQKPGIYLADYSDPESKTFDAKARFSISSEGITLEVNISIDEPNSKILIDASGSDKTHVDSFLKEAGDIVNVALDKYRVLSTEDKSRVRRALVAKTCWDRIIFMILKKRPLSEIYFQLAHGREMMIKATEGQDIHTITLSTSGWLSTVEPLPREDTLPGNIATPLAKKSVEWKRDTQEVIQQYI